MARPRSGGETEAGFRPNEIWEWETLPRRGRSAKGLFNGPIIGMFFIVGTAAWTRRWRGCIHSVAGRCATRAGPVDCGCWAPAVCRSSASVRPDHGRCGCCARQRPKGNRPKWPPKLLSSCHSTCRCGEASSSAAPCAFLGRLSKFGEADRTG